MRFEDRILQLKSKLVVVSTGECEGEPSFSGATSSGVLDFDFMLDESWDSLKYWNNNSTHKIAGLKDSLLGFMIGYNSCRLGLRCVYDENGVGKNFFAPVNYVHRGFKTSWEQLKGAPRIYTKKPYNCRVIKRGGGTEIIFSKIESDENGIAVLRGSTSTLNEGLNIRSPQLSGLWVELKNDPSPIDLKTYIHFNSI